MNETLLNGRVIVNLHDTGEQKADAVVYLTTRNLGAERIGERLNNLTGEYPNDLLPIGQAIITPGGHLPYTYILYTADPVYGMNQSRDAALLDDCYRNCLNLAHDFQVRTILFPFITTAAFRFPKGEAAEIFSAAVKTFFDVPRSVEEIRLMLINREEAGIFLKYQKF